MNAEHTLTPETKDTPMPTSTSAPLLSDELLAQIVAECEHTNLHLAEDLEVVDGATSVEVSLAEEGIGEGTTIVKVPFVAAPRSPQEMVDRLTAAYESLEAARAADNVLEGIVCDGVVQQYLVYLNHYVTIAATEMEEPPTALVLAYGAAMDAEALSDVLEGLDEDLEDIHAQIDDGDDQYDPAESFTVHIARQVIETKHERELGAFIFLAMLWLRGGEIVD